MNKIFFITPLILQKIIWIPTRIILKVFGRLKVIGLENLYSLKGGAIFASNHSSELDPILLPASLPFFSRFSPIFYTSKSKEYYRNSGWRQNFYGGFFFKIWGAHPVYSGLKDYEKALENHIELLKHNKSLFVFPEGRITRDGMIQPARGGIAYLSEISGKPIVPVRIEGIYNMRVGDFFRRKNKIIFKIGKPIEKRELEEIANTSDDSENVYRIRAEYVMSRVKGI